MQKKINKIINVTRSLINDCSLDNGGIVAANSSKKYFSKEAKNYFYIWPRDASFSCIGADILGLTDIPEKFFDWSLNNAEGFSEEGLFYEKYYPNGLKALPRFQPDQTGAFLYALWYHIRSNPFKINDKKYIDLITKAANGICGVWDKIHFIKDTNDLWEERICFSDLNENFTYSLASCIRGLRCANDLIPDKNWLEISKEMSARLDNHYIDFFVRSYGALSDKRIDASILGLVYPFEIYEASDMRMINSINQIEEKLLISGGVHRYEHDEYDGWMKEGEHRKKGAGAWPLLNFWLAIYYVRKGDVRKAEQHYNWVLDRIENEYIPEQIFENNIQVSVSPLLWSHIMFVIASKELGYI